MASSSGPAADRIPATWISCPESLDVSITIRSPIEIPKRRANFSPTTQESPVSENHLPSTCHQGLVFSIPVTKLLPSGKERVCEYQEPMKAALLKTPGPEVRSEER